MWINPILCCGLWWLSSLQLKIPQSIKNKHIGNYVPGLFYKCKTPFVIAKNIKEHCIFWHTLTLNQWSIPGSSSSTFSCCGTVCNKVTFVTTIVSNSIKAFTNIHYFSIFCARGCTAIYSCKIFLWNSFEKSCSLYYSTVIAINTEQQICNCPRWWSCHSSALR